MVVITILTYIKDINVDQNNKILQDRPDILTYRAPAVL